MFDRFYPIFDSPEWLERMLPLGLKLVQLRCKTREGEALRKAITTAQALCDAHDCILVVMITGAKPLMLAVHLFIWGKKTSTYPIFRPCGGLA